MRKIFEKVMMINIIVYHPNRTNKNKYKLILKKIWNYALTTNKKQVMVYFILIIPSSVHYSFIVCIFGQYLYGKKTKEVIFTWESYAGLNSDKHNRLSSK